MFVQSAKFVENHKKSPSSDIDIYDQGETAAAGPKHTPSFRAGWPHAI